MAQDPSSEERGGSEEIATSTLAEIYAQQGLLGRALAIYRRMQARTPEDPSIAERIDRLERRIAESEPADPAPGAAPPAGQAEPAPIERERLPWDPPAPEPPPDAPPPPEVARATPRRVERLDERSFSAWLEGR